MQKLYSYTVVLFMDTLSEWNVKLPLEIMSDFTNSWNLDAIMNQDRKLFMDEIPQSLL